MSSKERDLSIDAVKGVCILCIALLHFENGYFPPRLNFWIGLFMVPGFYFVSGYLLARKETLPQFREFAYKRLVQLGWPYLMFAVLALVFDIICALCGWMTWKIVLREGYKALVLHGVGPLWFLPVLFLSECFFLFVATRRHIMTLSIISVIASLAIYHLYFGLWLPRYRNLSDGYRMIDAVIAPYAYSCWGWIVVACGFIFGKHMQIKKISCVYYIALGVASILLSVVLMYAKFHVPFLDTLLSNILPVIGMLFIFSTMGANFLKRSLAFWGQNSLLVMCLHYTIFEEVCKIIDLRVFEHSEFWGWPPLAYFMLTMVSLYFLMPVFKNHLHFMLSPR